ncbi:hypothetical protein ACG3SL_12730 [Sphingomonas sp. CJ20]
MWMLRCSTWLIAFLAASAAIAPAQAQLAAKSSVDITGPPSGRDLSDGGYMGARVESPTVIDARKNPDILSITVTGHIGSSERDCFIPASAYDAKVITSCGTIGSAERRRMIVLDDKEFAARMNLHHEH